MEHNCTVADLWDLDSVIESPLEYLDEQDELGEDWKENQIFRNASWHDLSVRFVKRDDFKLLNKLRVCISHSNKKRYGLNFDEKKLKAT